MIIHVPVSLVGSPGWYYVLGTNIMPTQIATNQGKIQSICNLCKIRSVLDMNDCEYVCYVCSKK